ncbi:MAG TPA: hypothetical protein VK425_10210, partial [Acidimicrobiales bacterium]|nr:hypothetical protein [Acidimicrobiales bacterium]
MELTEDTVAAPDVDAVPALTHSTTTSFAWVVTSGPVLSELELLHCPLTTEPSRAGGDVDAVVVVVVEVLLVVVGTVVVVVVGWVVVVVVGTVVVVVVEVLVVDVEVEEVVVVVPVPPLAPSTASKSTAQAVLLELVKSQPAVAPESAELKAPPARVEMSA